MSQYVESSTILPPSNGPPTSLSAISAQKWNEAESATASNRSLAETSDLRQRNNSIEFSGYSDSAFANHQAAAAEYRCNVNGKHVPQSGSYSITPHPNSHGHHQQQQQWPPGIRLPTTPHTNSASGSVAAGWSVRQCQPHPSQSPPGNSLLLSPNFASRPQSNACVNSNSMQQQSPIHFQMLSSALAAGEHYHAVSKNGDSGGSDVRRSSLLGTQQHQGGLPMGSPEAANASAASMLESLSLPGRSSAFNMLASPTLLSPVDSRGQLWTTSPGIGSPSQQQQVASHNVALSPQLLARQLSADMAYANLQQQEQGHYANDALFTPELKLQQTLRLLEEQNSGSAVCLSSPLLASSAAAREQLTMLRSNHTSSHQSQVSQTLSDFSGKLLTGYSKLPPSPQQQHRSSQPPQQAFASAMASSPLGSNGSTGILSNQTTSTPHLAQDSLSIGSDNNRNAESGVENGNAMPLDCGVGQNGASSYASSFLSQLEQQMQLQDQQQQQQRLQLASTGDERLGGFAGVKQERCHTPPLSTTNVAADQTTLEAVQAMLSFHQQNAQLTMPSVSSTDSVAQQESTSMRSSDGAEGLSADMLLNLTCSKSIVKYQPISPASAQHSPTDDRLGEAANGLSDISAGDRITNGHSPSAVSSNSLQTAGSLIEQESLPLSRQALRSPLAGEAMPTRNAEGSLVGQQLTATAGGAEFGRSDTFVANQASETNLSMQDNCNPPARKRSRQDDADTMGHLEACSGDDKQRPASRSSLPHSLSLPLVIASSATDASHPAEQGAEVATAAGLDTGLHLQPSLSRSTPALSSSSNTSSSLSPVSSSNYNNGSTAGSSGAKQSSPLLSKQATTNATILSGVLPNVFTCEICEFTSMSKFHFNSHMNTHSDRKCDHCDYTSRTEGRLKRHMKDFHSHPSANATTSSNEANGDSFSDDEALLPESHSDAGGSRDSETPGSAGFACRDKSSSTVPSKPKTHKCKQCAFTAQNKAEFWAHTKAHIKGDKLLSCTKCAFVTEYKHHLEYHLRNHFGSKPFKCTKCNYSCVNKSMLNSHMKSHSSFYQYRCSDCSYATKYCHSLKLHLRKYTHSPATVVNPDGTMVEAETIDVYGNRRGPRNKKNNTPPLGSNINAFFQTPSTSSGLNLGSDSASLSHLSTSAASAYGHGEGSGNKPSSSMPTTPLLPFVEALQSTLLAQASAGSSVCFQDGTKLLKQTIAAPVAMHSLPTTTIGKLGASLFGPSLPTISSLTADLGVLACGSRSSGVGPSNAASFSQFSGLNRSFGPASNSSHVYKCSLCDYASNTREVLTNHVILHIVENKELCNAYGISHENIPSVAAQLTATINATYLDSQQQPSISGFASNNNSLGELSRSNSAGPHSFSIRLTSPESIFAAVQQLQQPASCVMGSEIPMSSIMPREHRSQKQLAQNVCGNSAGAHVVGGGGAAQEAQSSSVDSSPDGSTGRFTPSHELSQSSNSPASASGERKSEDEGSSGQLGSEYASAPTQSRRKGKAYKLERIALKLSQERLSQGPSPTADGTSGTATVCCQQSTSEHSGNTQRYLQQQRQHHRRSLDVSASAAVNVHNGSSSDHALLVNQQPQARSFVQQSPHSSQHDNPQHSRHSAGAPTGLPLPAMPAAPHPQETGADWSKAYVCNYCDIAFKDCIMYTMHMGYHGYQDPFKCNMCGHVSHDRLSMFLHIARAPHV